LQFGLFEETLVVCLYLIWSTQLWHTPRIHSAILDAEYRPDQHLWLSFRTQIFLPLTCPR